MKYICPICGYVYDEAKEAVPFAQLPEDWVCPVCRAAKSVFTSEQTPAKAQKPIAPIHIDPDIQKLSPGALAALFSNLARGCEKQYKPREQALFQEIADYFTAAAPTVEAADKAQVAAWLARDLDEYPFVKSTAEEHADRGTQRICVWGEKVTRMAHSLLSQYEREGEAMLAGKEVWVCTVCGFLYIGDAAPALCPVCKVPDWKFEKVEGRVSA